MHRDGAGVVRPVAQRLLKRLTQWPTSWIGICGCRLRQVVWGSDGDLLDSTEFAQPALFAVEMALFAVLRRWGVRPGFCDGSFGG